MQEKLDIISWDSFDDCTNPTIAWDLMYCNFLNVLNGLAPRVSLMRVNEKDPWVTTELLSLVRERDELKPKSDRYMINDNFVSFKKKHNLVKRSVITAKRNYIISRFKKADKNPKKYWKDLRNVFPSDKSKSSDKSTIILNDDLGSVLPVNQQSYSMIISLRWFKLASLIQRDNSSYLSGFDNARLIKMNTWEPINFEERVMRLFNLVLETGEFPDIWKVACVIPLYKSGCKKSVDNYRPISLLHLMGKLLEKALHRRLYCFLDNTDFIAQEHRPNLGTENAISNLLKYFYENINNKNSILSIYFDLSKAFNTINHSILLLKLKYYGISDVCLRLIKKYLS